MYIFDYIFYRVCKAYSTTISTDPAGTSMCIVALVQGLNIMTGMFLYILISHNDIPLNKFIFGAMAVVLLIFNYLRYIYRETRSYKILSERWANEPKGLKIKNGILTTVYIILSICLSFGLAIYLGSKKY